jgi:hypothetical protein
MLLVERQLWGWSDDLRAADVYVAQFPHGRHLDSRWRLDNRRLWDASLSPCIDRADFGRRRDYGGGKNWRRVQFAPADIGRRSDDGRW